MKAASAVWVGWAAAVMVSALGGARAEEGVALEVRLVRPEEQGERLLGLCRGSKAANPAAALAGWKHATGGRKTLGKPLEAALALLNPSMVREFRGLDGAEFLLSDVPAAGRVRWRAVVPSDDGSFAALAPALALTDGAIAEPLGASPVFRLGPPGTAHAAVRDGRLTLGSTRDELRAGLDRPVIPRPDANEPSGVVAQLVPAELRSWTSIGGRRLSAGLDSIGCTDAEGRLALDGQTITLDLKARVAPDFAPAPALDPSWLDLVPASGVVAAVSVALDTTAGALDAAFAALDRIERADPERAGVAPIRTRLNLLAAAARVQPELDLWPKLRGVTVALLVDPEGRPTGAIAALHATDDRAAERIARDVLPRFARSFLKVPKEIQDKTPGTPADTRYLGTIEERPLQCVIRGRLVLVGWGATSLRQALTTFEHPEQSAGPALREGWGVQPPQRAGGVWLGRLGPIVALGSPLIQALEGAPPVVWQGRTDGATSRDRVRWTNLRGVVKRWLDAIPFEPPPDR